MSTLVIPKVFQSNTPTPVEEMTPDLINKNFLAVAAAANSIHDAQIPAGAGIPGSKFAGHPNGATGQQINAAAVTSAKLVAENAFTETADGGMLTELTEILSTPTGVSSPLDLPGGTFLLACIAGYVLLPDDVGNYTTSCRFALDENAVALALPQVIRMGRKTTPAGGHRMAFSVLLGGFVPVHAPVVRAYLVQAQRLDAAAAQWFATLNNLQILGLR